MLVWRWTPIAAVGFCLAVDAPLLAAEQVGEAVLIKTSVTGDGGSLATRSPVHRDERIRTSNTGLGEFVFRDGTKFAVGWNSSITIDKFVFNDDKSVKNLTINAAKGTFRWISGGSNSSAYKIRTPSGTLGIRGTAFDFYVGANGKTAVVLLNGSVRFCGSNGCRELKRRCDVLVATPRGGVSDPRRVDRNIFKDLGNQRALPFMSGDQGLSGKFRVPGGSGCLSTASLNQSYQKTIRGTAAPAPSPPDVPDPPGVPDPPDPPGVPNAGGHPNNGKANGGGDGSPNGRNDGNR